MTILYAIKRNGKFLKDVEPNEHYSKTGTAPTIGNAHTYAEYKTVWSLEPAYFEHLTLCNYIKILLQEYRWGDKKPADFKIIPSKK